MRFVNNVKVMNKIMINAAAGANADRIVSFPEQIVLMINERCNYRCIKCNQNHDNKHEMPMAYFADLEHVLPFVERVTLTGGEPLLHSGIEDIFAMLGRHSVATWLVTNAALLEERKCAMLIDYVAKIKVSIDAATDETYRRMHKGGRATRALANLAKLASMKLTKGVCNPSISFNFVALRENIGELKKLVAVAASIGVDEVNVIHCKCWNEELAESSLYFDQQRSDEEMLIAREMGKELGVTVSIPPLFAGGNETELINSYTQNCNEPWRFALVELNGEVKNCCGGHVVIGNMNENSFADIWNSEATKELRRTVNTSAELDVCRNCTLCKQKSENIYSFITNRALADAMLEKKSAA